MDVRKANYDNPWDMQHDIVENWKSNGIKTERFIIGEYYYIYKLWLMELLRLHKMDHVERRANFAIMAYLARKKVKPMTNEIKLLLTNVLLRSGAVIKDAPHISMLFQQQYKKHPECMKPLLTTKTYAYMLQNIRLKDLVVAAKETFAGKNAYKTNVKKINVKKGDLNTILPYPSYDLLFAYYVDHETNFRYPPSLIELL